MIRNGGNLRYFGRPKVTLTGGFFNFLHKRNLKLRDFRLLQKCFTYSNLRFHVQHFRNKYFSELSRT